MDYVRQDIIAAAAVEKAIAATLMANLQAGARILSENGLPLETALRVLLHPSQRRAGDWRH